MKKRFSLGLLASLISGQLMATNPVPGWYGGFIATLSYPPSIDFNIYVPPPLDLTLKTDLKYRVMGGGGGQLGYRLNNCFRFEMEGFFNTNDYSSITVNGFKIPRKSSNNTTTGLSQSGRTNLIMGMLNAFYEIPSPNMDRNIIPYVGLGAGYVSVQNRVVFYLGENEIPGTRYNKTTTGAAGQGIVGFSYFLDDFTSASFDYRYVSTLNTLKEFEKRYMVHTLNFSMNFSFIL